MSPPGAWRCCRCCSRPRRSRPSPRPQLKHYFEGKRVTLKIAMPGTEEGVDIYPGTDRPLDYPRYADRLKDHGTAIRAGDDAMITKIRVKSKHIEFQLDGGGYGTMSDETSTSVNVASTPKSKREQNLEAELKREKDPLKRRELKEELDDLQNDREREDARNRAEVADAEEQKKQNIRQRRLEGGSRFNVRYRDLLPAGGPHAEGLEGRARRVRHLPTRCRSTPSRPPSDRPGASDLAAAPAPRSGLPRKGMTAGDVESLLGKPVESSERTEGKLRVVTRIYPIGRRAGHRGVRRGRAVPLFDDVELTPDAPESHGAHGPGSVTGIETEPNRRAGRVGVAQVHDVDHEVAAAAPAPPETAGKRAQPRKRRPSVVAAAAATAGWSARPLGNIRTDGGIQVRAVEPAEARHPVALALRRDDAAARTAVTGHGETISRSTGSPEIARDLAGRDSPGRDRRRPPSPAT